MDDIHCSHCGGRELQPGFLEDAGGNDSLGYLRWIPGELETGFFGGARRLGKVRVQVDAYRCTGCSHLELFVAPHSVPDENGAIV
jgi:hypothetical protein